MYARYKREVHVQALEELKKEKAKDRWQGLFKRLRWYEAKAAVPGIICVGIDIGSAASGYAYAFHRDFVIDPAQVKSPTWVQDGSVSFKTPSSVLVNADMELVDFGYGAEDNYANISEEQKTTHFLFRDFKSQTLEQLADNQSPEVSDVTGSLKCSAVKIFSVVIKHLWKHFRDSLRAPFNVNPDDIFTILIVPSDAPEVQDFYMKTAKRAGLYDKQVMYVTEAEAALRHFKVRADLLDPEIKARTKTVLVLDNGGCDVRCTLFRRQPDSGVQHIYMTTMKSLGALGIAYAFNTLLENIFKVALPGQDVRTDLREMMTEIEKSLSSLHEKTSVTMRIPAPIYNLMKSKTPDLSGSEFDGSVRFTKNRIRLSRELVDSGLSGVLNDTTNKVKAIFSKGDEFDAETILLAGGISSLRFYQDHMRSAFPTKTVCASEQSSLLVLNGAVTFGHETKCEIPLKW